MFRCLLNRATINWVNLYHSFPRQKYHLQLDSLWCWYSPPATRVLAVWGTSRRTVLLWKEEISRTTSSAPTQNKREVSGEGLSLMDTVRNVQETHLVWNRPNSREVTVESKQKSSVLQLSPYKNCLHLLSQVIRNISSCSDNLTADCASVRSSAFLILLSLSTP